MDVSAVNKSAFEGNLEELTELLLPYTDPSKSSSLDINKLVDPQDSNRGPLHFAVLGKRANIVQFLLERLNCSPFQLDEDGWSPLHVAASVGSDEIIELLLESVANYPSSSVQDAVTLYCNQATQTRAKNYPLHLAASKGHEQAVMRLLAHGAKASARNAFGQTPLHRAACAGKPLIVAVLMEADASTVNWKDFSEDQNTALHLAAEDGHMAVVKLLVELAHVDTSILNAEGKTAAQVAQSPEMRDYLTE